jgi:hemolysin D
MLLERLRHWKDVAQAAFAEQQAAGAPVQRQRNEIEFLPAALEILETPISPAGRSMMWSVMVLFAIALIWSIVGKVDVVAVAPGKIVPNGQSKVIQPLEAGIVKTILVENGQHVKEGQSLIELDPTQAAADADKSRTARVDAMLAAARAKALLEAQASDLALEIPHVADADDVRQRDAQRLAESLFAEYRGKLTALRAELEKREHELETTKHKIDGLRQTAPMAKALAEDYQKLLNQNYVSKHVWLEKEQARIQQEEDLAAQQSYARELRATIDEQRQNVANATAQFKREQLDALNQAQQQLAQFRNDETKSLQRQRQTTLTAPVSGTVQQLTVHTVGGVVTPAQEVLVIVPDAASLEFEAQLLNQDIGFVRADQVVEIKLDAFPYTHYGTIAGTVMAVSHDAVKDDKQELVYPVRIKLSTAVIAMDGKAIAMTPGMMGQVEIKTDRRRIIEYLLEPVRKYRSEAMRER